MSSEPMITPSYDELATEGVLGRRLVAYLIDLVIIGAFILLLGFAILILGVITFGLGWLLFAILIPGAAILYSAITISGPRQSTIGMRMTGLRVITASRGAPVDALTAAVHALLFYVAAGSFLLWVVDILIGFARSDRRLARDIIVNLVVVRADAVAP
jgi:uncharacterized RDD family membrane protein YckC